MFLHSSILSTPPDGRIFFLYIWYTLFQMWNWMFDRGGSMLNSNDIFCVLFCVKVEVESQNIVMHLKKNIFAYIRLTNRYYRYVQRKAYTQHRTINIHTHLYWFHKCGFWDDLNSNERWSFIQRVVEWMIRRCK